MSSKNTQVSSIEDDISAAATELSGVKNAIEVKGNGSDLSLSGEKIMIKIHQGREGDTEAPFVFIGLNGYGYQIPRGVPVIIPIEALEVLENAVMKTYPTEGGIVIGEREVPRFGYQEVRGAEKQRVLEAAAA